MHKINTQLDVSEWIGLLITYTELTYIDISKEISRTYPDISVLSATKEHLRIYMNGQSNTHVTFGEIDVLQHKHTNTFITNTTKIKNNDRKSNNFRITVGTYNRT